MLTMLSSAQMKELDARAIKEFGLSARILMETAGKGCADLIIQEYCQYLDGRICVLCGKGNNGGDGAVIARWLDQYGFEVAVLQIGSGRLSPETKANIQLCRALDIPILQFSETDDLPLLEELLSGSSLVVDAIYGTGFRGDPDAWTSALFGIVNSTAAYLISVDIPSGLNADTGWCQDAVYAEATFCIDSLKLGHILGLGREVCGELKIIPIGIPRQYYRALDSVKIFTDEDFLPPIRYPDLHKNDYGKVYIFGGIPGYTGASVLAAQAALRAGAGYAYVLHRIELMAVYALKLTEALSLAIPENVKTGLPDAKILLHLLSDASAVLIGPGLGRDDFSLKLLETALKHLKCPLVVDADGLNLISENPILLKYLAKPNILITPHWGEFARLASMDKDLLEVDCLTPLRAFVQKYKARVLLKSHFSIYHDGSLTLVNNSGNDGLATGGSGDVLAGIITSFLAQKQTIPEAAINASFLLGATAEKLAETRATPSILPSDVIEHLFLAEP